MEALLICKSVLGVRHALSSTTFGTRNFLGLRRNDHSSPLLVSLRCISSTTDTNQNDNNSFAVSYLINKCGLSPASALSVSRHVVCRTPDKPDLVIELLEKHGFSKSQITKVVQTNPSVLNYGHPEKTLLPKLEFFYSKGCSRTDVVKMLSSSPWTFTRSLKNGIVPCFDFLKHHLKTNDAAVFSILRLPRILTVDVQALVTPNIACLQQYGVRQSSITYLLKHHPDVLCTKPHRFKEIVEEVKEMGISPLLFKFAVAIEVKTSVSKSSWESKLNILKQWGLSEEQILSAFAAVPKIMALSKDNILAKMEFLVKEMSWEASQIFRCPQIVCYSLKKRIIPRCAVIRVLWNRRLIEQTIGLGTVFVPSDVLFLQRFVMRFEKEVPYLMKLYQEHFNSLNNRDFGRAETMEDAV